MVVCPKSHSRIRFFVISDKGLGLGLGILKKSPLLEHDFDSDFDFLFVLEEFWPLLDLDFYGYVDIGLSVCPRGVRRHIFNCLC